MSTFRRDVISDYRKDMIREIAAAYPGSPLSAPSFLSGKSDDYLAARVANLRGGAAKPTPRQDSREEGPVIHTDAYGRPLYGSFQSPACDQARADADAAYAASVARINANRADQSETLTPADKARAGAAKGNEFEPDEPDRGSAIRDLKREARLNEGEVKANEAYQRSVERLNASRTKQHPTGQPVKL